MCGIVGYVGDKKAQDILLTGLEKLEYRGYDSAGIALLSDCNNLTVIKTVGKLQNLRETLKNQDYPSQIGIGHTRWATHGVPSTTNAHPHTDLDGRFAIAHNGIIENYLALKKELESQDYKFSSQTDTEVIAALLWQLGKKHPQLDTFSLVLKMIKKLTGSYALAILDKENPTEIIAVRQDSPLVIGLGENGNFISSDVTGIIEHTKKVYILENGEVAKITSSAVKVFDNQGQKVNKKVQTIAWDLQAARKEGYPHFTLKEIYEQPVAIQAALLGRIKDKKLELNELSVQWTAKKFASINKIIIVGCGTAYHAGFVAKHWWEELIGVPVEIEIASEFRYKKLFVDKKTLLVVVSQSGETSDSIAALRRAQELGAKTIGVCNAVGSTIAREVDTVLYTQAGPEIAVASTKAYTTQLTAFLLVALYFAKLKGSLSIKKEQAIIAEIIKLPELVKEALQLDNACKAYAQENKDVTTMFFIGRLLDYVASLEGALKLKEISYVNAEAYAAGELKHGTLALVTEDTPTIAIITQPAIMAKTLSNIQEVRARGAKVLGIGSVIKDEVDWTTGTDEQLILPTASPLLTPILSAIPLQLFAYHMAVLKGCDVDKPRNLAKSVTVE